MQSAQSDTKLFHKLVRQQRNKKTMTTHTMVLMVKNNVRMNTSSMDGKDTLRNFTNIVKLIYRNSIVKNLNLVTLQNDIIEKLKTGKNEKIDNTNQKEIQNILRKLKSGKSHAPDGLSAEYFKYMPDELLPFLIAIIKSVFEDEDVPQVIMEGVITSYKHHVNTNRRYSKRACGAKPPQIAE
ncbi:unnamed protein product [Mytilus coruscus]|uniref:Uncharacterized protein n=1 Tax=Mytilus coruscus TaxID=42192 RepID=A0A6J8BJY8_MYTCO|nr:unnamed protein product [Mytilus coruscus]